MRIADHASHQQEKLRPSGIMPGVCKYLNIEAAVRKVLDVILVLATLELCFFLFKQAMRWFP
jgi:phage shock protein PspC (stress-responsive transcriptional regulator)